MTKILTKPSYGWSSLNLTDVNGVEHSFTLSYIDDVSYMLLNTIDKSFTNPMYLNGDDFNIQFDAEDWGWNLVSNWDSAYVITSKDKLEIFEFEIERIELVKAILDCLEEDYQEWGNFCCDVNESCYELNANDFLAEVKRVKEKVDNWFCRD
jgi:hypothetical protein